MRRFFLLLLLVASAGLCAGPLAAGALTASVDPPPVSQSDTFELVLSLAGRDSLEPPNLAPLARDFEILDRGKRSRPAIPGVRPAANEWVMTLAPRRAGRLTIPSLSVAGETSEPIEIEIAPGPVNGPPDDGPLSLLLEAGGSPPYYVQSDVPVRLRIFDRVGAADVSYTLFRTDGAISTPLDQPRSYWRTFGTQRYRVVELRSLMRPQRAGTVAASPVTLSATIPDAAGGGRRIEVRSNPFEVTVRPRPEGVDGWFLPARAVTLSATWSGPPDKARVGVALTRTIRLVAQGAGANQLPSLVPPEADGARQYPDDAPPLPALVDSIPGAALETNVSVVPTRAGTVTLPAMSVPWWNTQTERNEVATLPEETLTVAPERARAAPATSARVVSADRAPATPEASAGLARWLRWFQRAAPSREVLAGAAGAALLLGAGLLLVRRGRRSPAGGAPEAAPSTHRAVARSASGRPHLRPGPSPAAAKGGAKRTAPRAKAAREETATARAVEAACKGGNAAAVHRAYLAWRRSAAPGARSGAGKPATDEMARALHDLSQHLYAGASGGFDGRAFRKAFAAEQRALRRGGRNPSAPRLAPLYPHGR